MRANENRSSRSWAQSRAQSRARSRAWSRPAALVAALAVLTFAAPALGNGVGAVPSLFGTVEVRSPAIQNFPKWTAVLDRMADERTVAEQPCTPSFFTRCNLEEWRALMQELRGRPPLEQIEAINDFMNRVSYITDPANYNMPDYWATPRQHLTRRGDCEDYAIAKYVSLRALGFPEESLRILVLDDLNLRIPHAVLVVILDGRALLLDNQIRSVVEERAVRHYRPIYSINATAFWIHRSQ